MIIYRATPNVPRELVWFVAKLLLPERRKRGTPRGGRALSCFWQAVMGLRWFRDRTTVDALARDHGVSRATAYRYLDEVILVLAQQAPDLRRMLERAKGEGFSHAILDGKIIAYDDLGSSDLEVPHLSESGSALAVRRSGCLDHVVIYGEDHPAYRGEFLEACCVGRGGLALG